MLVILALYSSPMSDDSKAVDTLCEKHGVMALVSPLPFFQIRALARCGGYASVYQICKPF